ncbi:MAG: HAD family hydrolase [Anaerolineae bacterium]|jgi:putative hydrolase of the HAD superfamily|nr:HAD family hydrolase [Anaerolineae bacterium]
MSPMNVTRKNHGEGEVLIESVRTILFDFDGTLVFHKPDSFDIVSDFCSDIGQPLDEETARRGRRMRHEYFVDPAIRSELDGLSRDEFWDHFNRHLLEGMGIAGNLDRLAREVSARFAEAEMVYDCPEVGGKTLGTLQGRGYHLGLLTNRENVDRFHDLLEQFDLPRYFSMILAAGEVGVSKPNPGIFRAALERMETSPEEALYVGDNYWADVLGAEAAGIRPALLDPMGLFPEAECVVLERIEDLLLQLQG